MDRKEYLKTLNWISIGRKIEKYARLSSPDAMEKVYQLIKTDFGKREGELIFNGLLVYKTFGRDAYYSDKIPVASREM